MHVDQQTYRDLDIFESGDGARSLFDLLNGTRTMGGSRALRRRMRNPFNNAEPIASVQASLRHILSHRQGFRLIPPDFTITGFERYLHGSLPVITTANPVERALEALEVRWHEAGEYLRIRRGVEHTMEITRTLRSLVAATTPVPGEVEIAAWLGELDDLLQRAAIRALTDADPRHVRFWRVLAFDRVIRDHERKAFERMIEIICELDALVALADIAGRDDWVLPEIQSGTGFCCEGLYHPFLARPVGNNVRVCRDLPLLFVTGPNMAGKTTFLRACGIALYLAHLGVAVPARSFSFAPCEVLFSSINLTDDLRQGVSFFRAEALRMKEIVRHVAGRQRVIAIMDEPFMGTNVKDALEASHTVLSALSTARDCSFLVSSHLIELGDVLAATGRVRCSYFAAAEHPDGLVFDYLLHDGISAQRLGMRVLREEGVLDLIAGLIE
jgi:DNA mismatch repair protein MutS